MDEMLKALIEANNVRREDCEPKDRAKELEDALSALIGGETVEAD